MQLIEMGVFIFDQVKTDKKFLSKILMKASLIIKQAIFSCQTQAQVYRQNYKLNEHMSQVSFFPNDRFINSKPLQNVYNPFLNDSMFFNSPQDSSYCELIRKNLFGVKKPSGDQLTDSSSSSSHPIKSLDTNLSGNSVFNEDKNVLSPVKILDVPNIKDDFYLNLVDWHDKGPVAIALNDQAYIYTPTDINKLTKVFNTYISSVKFTESILSVGLSNGGVEVYDLQKFSIVRSVKNHSLRVSSLAFSQSVMISGSKDRLINLSDLRIKQALTKSIQCHNGEVCSIKVKPDQQNVFASGANDNRVCIFDIRACAPLATLKGHKGAVKAISWCPWKANTLATGGGKNDRTVKIWNQSMEVVCEKELKSQISGLEWNSRYRFLVSSHGGSSNEICLWNWDGQQNLSKINGSKNFNKRVLNLLQSKQEDMVCTLSSDETLKFFQFKEANDDKKQIYDSAQSKNNNFRRIL